jgi:hypothetical protein
MSIAPKSRMKAGLTKTLLAEDQDSVADFLIDHGFDRDPEEYLVWINRRRVGPRVQIEPGDSVTIGPRTIPKAKPLSATRPRIVFPIAKKESLGEMFRRWDSESTEEEDRLAFEEFKQAINETRAREGRPPVYP